MSTKNNKTTTFEQDTTTDNVIVPIADENNDNNVGNSNNIEISEKKKTKKEKENVHFLAHPFLWTLRVLKRRKINFLLIFFVPAIVLKKYEVDELVVFCFNFVAIIPLSSILSVGLEDLVARIGPVC